MTPQTPQAESVTIEALTPALAQSLLEANHGNRAVRMTQVENLARLMAEGLWRFNGDTIRVAKDGTLLDGQHRCMACVRSQVTLPQQVIVRGLENETQATMDQGIKRSASDVLGMANISNGGQIASVARLVSEWKKGKRGIPELNKTARNQLSNDEIRMWAQQDPDLVKAAQMSIKSSMRSLVNPKAGGTLWYLLNQSDPAKCSEFFELLDSGAGLEKGNPVLTLRNYWQNLRVQGHAPVPRYLDAGIRAWNRWMVGETMSMISQRLERDIPDVYVAPGTEDVVNYWPDAKPAQVGGPPTASTQSRPKPADPKPTPAPRRASAKVGAPSLFSER